jgi:hypothetical protein
VPEGLEGERLDAGPDVEAGGGAELLAQALPYAHHVDHGLVDAVERRDCSRPKKPGRRIDLLVLELTCRAELAEETVVLLRRGLGAVRDDAVVVLVLAQRRAEAGLERLVGVDALVGGGEAARVVETRVEPVLIDVGRTAQDVGLALEDEHAAVPGEAKRSSQAEEPAADDDGVVVLHRPQ